MKKRRLITVFLLLAISILSVLFAVGCGKKKDKDITCTVIVHNAQGEEVKTYTFDRSEGNRIEYRPSKEGHYFHGWVLNVTADTDDFYFNAYGSQVSNKSLSDGRINLYPVFLPYIYKFNLYSGDEGTFGYNSNKNTYYYKYEDGKPMGLIPVPEPNDPKASFVGYYSSSFTTQYTDGTGKLLDGMLEKPQNREESALIFDLYAQYAKRTVTITLDYDGRTKNREIKADYGLSFSKLDLSEYENTDGNKEVTGWEMPNGEEFPDVLTENITLKAVWTSFRDLDFYYTENDARTQRVYMNDEGKYVLPTPDDSARKGYRFKGWYQNLEYTGAVLVNATLSQNYYAKWQMAEYEVNFVCDNGETFDKKTYFYGDERELPVPTPSTGYTFGGWMETENGEVAFFKITSDMYGDKTLYAKWQPETYEVTLHAGYGLLEKTTDSVRFEQEYRLPVPQRTGYSFQGWYSAETGDGVRFTDPEGHSIKVWSETQGAEMYARYARKTYNVTYNTNGGTAVSAQKYAHGERFDFPENPTKTGYTFWGWYDEPIKNEYTEKETVRANVTLYARWLKESVAIADADGLKAIKNNPSGTYHLTKDINLMGEAWSPIPEFSGKLNGNGYKIFNFSMSFSGNLSSGTVCYGFIQTNKGTVTGVEFSGFTCGATFYGGGEDTTQVMVGCIAGRNEGLIQNCKVTGVTVKGNFAPTPGKNSTVRIASFMGSIAGWTGNGGKVRFCESDAVFNVSFSQNHGEKTFRCQMYGEMHISGISSVSTNGIISGCKYVGSITASHATLGGVYEGDNYTIIQVGGIAGYVSGGAKIWDSESTANISVKNTENWSKVSWEKREKADIVMRVGGISGVIWADSAVKNCISNGTVSTQTTQSIAVGGITGRNDGAVENCYSLGKVNQNGGASRDAGGIVGYNNANVKNCYFGGVVTCNDGTGSTIAGTNASTGTILNCFNYGDLIFKTSAGSKGTLIGNNVGSYSGCAYSKQMTFTAGGVAQTLSKVIESYDESELLSPNTIFNKFYFMPETWIVSEDGVKLYWEVWE